MTTFFTTRAGTNTGALRLVTAAEALALLGISLAVGALVLRPWDEALMFAAAALASVVSAWGLVRLMRRGHHLPIALAGMQLTLSICLATTTLFGHLNWTFLPGADTDRLCGALVGAFATLLMWGVVALRRGELMAGTVAELMSWPVLILVLCVLFLDEWRISRVVLWADTADQVNRVGLVWALVLAVLISLTVLMRLRRTLPAREMVLGSLVPVAVVFLVGGYRHQHGMAAPMMLMLAAAALAAAELIRRPPAYRVVGVIMMSVIGTLASDVASPQMLGWNWSEFLMLVALVAPPTVFLWFQARRRDETYPETPAAFAIGAVCAGVLFGGGFAGFWLQAAGLVASAVLVAAYYLWRRRTLPDAACGVLAIWWIANVGLGLLFIGLADVSYALLLSVLFLPLLAAGIAQSRGHAAGRTPVREAITILLQGARRWFSFLSEWGSKATVAAVYLALIAFLSPILNPVSLASLAYQHGWLFSVRILVETTLRTNYYYWPPRKPGAEERIQQHASEIVAALKHPSDPLTRVWEPNRPYEQSYAAGYRLLIAEGLPEVVDVAEDGPAARAGVERGMRLVSVAGHPLRPDYDPMNVPVVSGKRSTFPRKDLPQNPELKFAVQGGKTVTARLDGNRSEQFFRLRRLFVLEGRRVGYLAETASLSPFGHTLDEFYRADVSSMVLDLRYAGLGSVVSAWSLADGLRTPQADGKLFARLEFNERRAARVFNFGPGKDQNVARLGLAHLIVLTGKRTCGAAEMLIHGLRPHMKVVTVGDATCGAPYETITVPFVVGPPQNLELVVGRVYASDGSPAAVGPIEPTCRVADDFTQPRGSAQDPLYREAVHFLRHGRCSVSH